MIECITLENVHCFSGNPICEQHRLRYRSIIERQGWDVPVVRGLEYDQYDNPAAYYLVKRNEEGKAVGSSRLYPTDRPYMLQEIFGGLVTNRSIPCDPAVWEGSRFCVDQTLPPDERRKITQELVVAYLEFCMAFDIKAIVGVMYPVYWRNVFIRNGWNVDWMGDLQKSSEGHKIVAGYLRASKEVLEHVRKTTGIEHPVLNLGMQDERIRHAA